MFWWQRRILSVVMYMFIKNLSTQLFSMCTAIFNVKTLGIVQDILKAHASD